MLEFIVLLELNFVPHRSQKDLDILIGNMLDVWEDIDPTRIIEKPKLHTLSHAVEDICNHGPTILYSTEIFEC